MNRKKIVTNYFKFLGRDFNPPTHEDSIWVEIGSFILSNTCVSKRQHYLHRSLMTKQLNPKDTFIVIVCVCWLVIKGLPVRTRALSNPSAVKFKNPK